MSNCKNPVKHYVVYSSEYICGSCKELTYLDNEVKPLPVPHKIDYSLQIVECNIETIELLLVHKPTLQYKWEHLMESFKNFKVRVTKLREAFQNLITKKFWSRMEDIRPQIEQLKQEWKQSPILIELLLFRNSENIRLRVKGIDEEDSILNQNIRLKITLDKVRRERLQIETDLNTKIEKLYMHNSEIDSQRDQLQEELDSMKHRIAQLETQNTELETLNIELKAQNTELESQKIQLTTDLCKAKAQTEEKKVQIEDMKTSYAGLKTNYEDLKALISNKIDELNVSHSQTDIKFQKLYRRLEEQGSKFNQIICKNLKNMGMDLDWIDAILTTNQKKDSEQSEGHFKISQNPKNPTNSKESKEAKPRLNSTSGIISQRSSPLTQMLTKAYVKIDPSLQKISSPKCIEFLRQIVSQKEIVFYFNFDEHKKVFQEINKILVDHLEKITLWHLDQVETGFAINFLLNCIPDKLKELSFWGGSSKPSITPYLDSILSLKDDIGERIYFDCFRITAKEKEIIQEAFGRIKVEYDRKISFLIFRW
ncbi:unnamed protein product [Moneuplotes crassus]|uniref:Uncharacterized protein n=1 Tax=Euplotes crassus TaxID=5936 RepID=A0AAD1U7H6_EUPCR|nr:unnamed protein product [Moneuplotes crassus]